MNKGFSLIELLCSLIIGLIAISLSFGLYFQFKKISITQKELSDIQENGRFAVNILYSTLTQAGFIGSHKLTKDFPIFNDGVNINKSISYSNHIIIFQKDKLPNIEPKKNTDVVLVKYVDSFLNHIISLEDNRLKIKLKPKFNKGDDIMISDSNRAVLAHVSSVYFNRNFQYLTLSKNISEKFDENTEIRKLKTVIFFIGATNRRNKFGETIYSLYMLDERDRKQELVPNVESLKIKCLVKIKNKLQFKNFKDISDLSMLTGVQINLLLKSGNIHQNFDVVVPFKEHLS